MTDRRVVVMVIAILGLYALTALGLAGAIILLADGKHAIDPVGFGFLTTSGGTALGAVGGILAHTSSSPPADPPAG